MEEENKETLLENETGDVVPNEAIDENIDGMVGDDEEVISPIDSNSHLTADKTKSNVNNKLSVLPWVLSGFFLLALSIILSIFVNGFIAFGIIPALFIIYKGISNNNKNNKKKVEPYNIINFEKTQNIEQKQEIEKNKTQDQNKLITKNIKNPKNSNQKQKNYEKPSIEDFQKLLNFSATPSKEQKKENHSNVDMDNVEQDNNQMDFLKEYNNKQNKTNKNNKKVDFDLIKNSKQENTNNIK